MKPTEREAYVDKRVKEITDLQETCVNLADDIKRRAPSIMGLASLRELHASLIRLKREFNA